MFEWYTYKLGQYFFLLCLEPCAWPSEQIRSMGTHLLILPNSTANHTDCRYLQCTITTIIIMLSALHNIFAYDYLLQKRKEGASLDSLHIEVQTRYAVLREDLPPAAGAAHFVESCERSCARLCDHFRQVSEPAGSMGSY